MESELDRHTNRTNKTMYDENTLGTGPLFSRALLRATTLSFSLLQEIFEESSECMVPRQLQIIGNRVGTATSKP